MSTVTTTTIKTNLTSTDINDFLSCPTCGISFQLWNHMRRTLHLQACKKTSSAPISEQFICSTCQRVTKSKKGLTLHQKKCLPSSGRGTVVPTHSVQPVSNHDRGKTSRKRPMDEDLQTALALSRSMIDEAKRVKVHKAKEKKELPIPVTLTASKATKQAVLSARLSTLLFQSRTAAAAPCNSAFDNLTQNVCESHLWRSSICKADARDDEQCFFYVKALVPPISPCKRGRVSNQLLTLSQIPGREKDHWMSQMPAEQEPAVVNVKMTSDNVLTQGFLPDVVVEQASPPAAVVRCTWKSLLMDANVDPSCLHAAQQRLLGMLDNMKMSDLIVECDQCECVFVHKFVLASHDSVLDLEKVQSIDLSQHSRRDVLKVFIYLYADVLSVLTGGDNELDVGNKLGIQLKGLDVDATLESSTTTTQHDAVEASRPGGPLTEAMASSSCHPTSSSLSWRDDPVVQSREDNVPTVNEDKEMSWQPVPFSAVSSTPLHRMSSCHRLNMVAMPTSLVVVETNSSDEDLFIHNSSTYDDPSNRCNTPEPLPPDNNIQITSQANHSLQISSPHEKHCKDQMQLPPLSLLANSELCNNEKESVEQWMEVDLMSCSAIAPPSEFNDLPSVDMADNRSSPLPDDDVFCVNPSDVSSLQQQQQPNIVSQSECSWNETPVALSPQNVLNVSCDAVKLESTQVGNSDFPMEFSMLGHSVVMDSMPQMDTSTNNDGAPSSNSFLDATPLPLSLRMKQSDVLLTSPSHCSRKSPEPLQATENTSWLCDSALLNELQNSFHHSLSQPVSEADHVQATMTVAFITPQQKRIQQQLTSSVLSPLTPMPTFDRFLTPDLKKSLAEFGVRPLPKRKAIILLKEIYRYTHQDKLSAKEAVVQQNTAAASHSHTEDLHDAETGQGDEDEEEEEGDSQDNQEDFFDCPGALEESILILDDNNEATSAGSTKSSLEGMKTKQLKRSVSDPSLAGDMENQIIQFIRNDPVLLQSILLYEPLDLDVLHLQLKTFGIKLGKQRLMNFLDEKCITFSLKPRNVGRNKNVKKKTAAVHSSL